MKSVQIQNFFWSYLSIFGLNTEIYRVKNSLFGYFSRGGKSGVTLQLTWIRGWGVVSFKKDNLSGLCDREFHKMFNSIFFLIEHFLATDSDKKNIARITISTRPWPEGSHKLGSVLPFVRPSFLPAVFLELGR